VAAAAVVVVAEAAIGINPYRVFTRRGCLSGSPAISFLELPINAMQFSAF
jgi:hypothetical protein